MKLIALTLALAVSLCAQNTNLLTLTPKPDLSAQGELRMAEASNSPARNYIGLSAAVAIAAPLHFEWQDGAPTAGNCLSAGALTAGKYPLVFGSCGTNILPLNNNFTGDNTFHNIFFPTDNTYTIGTDPIRPTTIYAQNIDAAPGGTVTNYIKGRRFAIADQAGATAFWDITATASAGSGFVIRDNAGAHVLDIFRTDSFGAHINNAIWDLHHTPSITQTYDLGSPSFIWRNGYFGTITVNSCNGCVSSFLPIVDSTELIKGSVDATKRMRFEVDGFSSATTRVLTPQNASYTLAGLETTQSFTGDNTFHNIFFPTDNTYTIGTDPIRPTTIYAQNIDAAPGGTVTNYIKGRRFAIADQAGATAFWDITATASAGSGFVIRDNSGVHVLDIFRTDSFGAHINNAIWDLHHTPSITQTYDLGSPSFIWRNGYFGTITVNACNGCVTSFLPLSDATDLIKGSADTTKHMRFEVDGFSTGVTRVLTPQNANYTLAGLETSQSFTGDNTFHNIFFPTDNTYTIGTDPIRPTTIYAQNIDAAPGGTVTNYIKGRRFAIADQAGATAFWDITATASAGSGFVIRDNSGAHVLDILRTDSFAAHIDNAIWDLHHTPSITQTYDLGSPSFLWRNGYFGTITVNSCNGCVTSFLPLSDASDLIKGSGDTTKRMRFEVDGFSTGVTRVLTPLDASYTLAGVNVNNSFSVDQTFLGNVSAFSAGNAQYVQANKLIVSAGVSSNYQFLMQTTNQLQLRDNSGNLMASWDSSTARATVSADFYPGGSSATRNLGLPSAYWLNSYVATSNTNVISITNCAGCGVANTLIPTGDNLFNLGSSSFRWSNGIFANDVTANRFQINNSTVIDASKNANLHNVTLTSGGVLDISLGSCIGCSSGGGVTLNTVQTITAQKKFQAATSSNFSVLQLENTQIGPFGAKIEFRATDSSTSNIYNVAGIYGVFDSASFSNGRLTLQYVDAGGALADGMTLKNGKVGIGTLFPTSTLDIVASGANAELQATSYGAVPAFIGRAAQGSSGSPFRMSAGNTLMTIGGRGYTGSGAFTTSASSAVIFFAGEDWIDSSHTGAGINFATVPNTNDPSQRVTRLTIAPDGLATFTKQVVVGGVAGGAGLTVTNGWVDSKDGLTTASTSYQAIQAPSSGGVYARSLRAQNYVQVGQNSGAPSPTSGDAINNGALYYDTSTGTLRTYQFGWVDIATGSGAGLTAGSNATITGLWSFTNASTYTFSHGLTMNSSGTAGGDFTVGANGNLYLVTGKIEAYGGYIISDVGFKGPSGTAGASGTTTCAGGQAIKSITLSGGIVTAVTCAIP